MVNLVHSRATIIDDPRSRESRAREGEKDSILGATLRRGEARNTAKVLVLGPCTGCTGTLESEVAK